MLLDGGLAEPEKGLPRDGRCDVRVAVAITAHPATESQEQWYLKCVGRIIDFESPAKRIINLGHDFHQPRRNRQSTLHFLEHRWLARPEKIGLPQNGQVGAN